MLLCGADRSVLDLERKSCIQLVCRLLFYFVLVKVDRSWEKLSGLFWRRSGVLEYRT